MDASFLVLFSCAADDGCCLLERFVMNAKKYRHLLHIFYAGVPYNASSMLFSRSNSSSVVGMITSPSRHPKPLFFGMVWYGIYGTSWYLSTLVGASPHCPLLARAYLLHTYKLAREVGVLKQQQQQQQQQQMNSSAVPHHHIKEYYSPHFPQLGFTL